MESSLASNVCSSCLNFLRARIRLSHCIRPPGTLKFQGYGCDSTEAVWKCLPRSLTQSQLFQGKYFQHPWCSCFPSSFTHTHTAPNTFPSRVKWLETMSLVREIMLMIPEQKSILEWCRISKPLVCSVKAATRENWQQSVSVLWDSSIWRHRAGRDPYLTSRQRMSASTWGSEWECSVTEFSS